MKVEWTVSSTYYTTGYLVACSRIRVCSVWACGMCVRVCMCACLYVCVSVCVCVHVCQYVCIIRGPCAAPPPHYLVVCACTAVRESGGTLPPALACCRRSTAVVGVLCVLPVLCVQLVQAALMPQIDGQQGLPPLAGCWWRLLTTPLHFINLVSAGFVGCL